MQGLAGMRGLALFRAPQHSSAGKSNKNDGLTVEGRHGSKRAVGRFTKHGFGNHQVCRLVY